MTDSAKKNKITWVSLLNAIIQAAIAALTALGITVVQPPSNVCCHDTGNISHDCGRGGSA